MLPDFTLHFCEGRTLHRRELKGRAHAAIVFLPEQHERQDPALLSAIAAALSAWRATRAAVLVILPPGDDGSSVDPTLDPVLDTDGTLHARFGAGPGGALIVADRYGEIALRADGTEDAAGAGRLPLGEVTPTLELLEMRCSL